MVRAGIHQSLKVWGQISCQVDMLVGYVDGNLAGKWQAETAWSEEELSIDEF